MLFILVVHLHKQQKILFEIHANSVTRSHNVTEIHKIQHPEAISII